VEEIRQFLRRVEGSAMDIRFAGYGFFPTAKAPRVFWIGIESGQGLASLAASIDTSMHQLGIPKEEHAFSPHLTLARGNSGSPRWKKGDAPNFKFNRLQERLASMPAPEFGTMTAHEFHLFESKLSPGGSQYSKLRSFALT
jgi:2'-5' RNA ligase